jgi:hypothetical protein
LKIAPSPVLRCAAFEGLRTKGINESVPYYTAKVGEKKCLKSCCGPRWGLEGRYTPGKSPTAPIALILHPHPQHGGTMNNKVVYSLFTSFAERDFSTLRFNFAALAAAKAPMIAARANSAMPPPRLIGFNPSTRTLAACGSRAFHSVHG